MRHKGRHRGPVITMNWNSTLEVKTRVAVGTGARQKLSSILAQLNTGRRVLIVCQPSTAIHWLRELLDTLPGEDFQVTTLEVPDGEAAKTTEWLVRIWEHLQGRGFDRRDTVVALGGGAVLDLASFACSTYMRGLNLVCVPTTLLAQVDAAIGGKNAINLPGGKNLAGTFFFPRAVLADQEVLSTLPEGELTAGMAEIIKYAMIEETVAKATDYEKGPRPLIELLEDMLKNPVEWDEPMLGGLITSCIKMKLYVAQKDPHESNIRRCLNLGHTLAHALEAQSEYGLSHGQAVAIGLAQTSKFAVSQKKLDKESHERVKDVIIKAGLPHEIPKGLAKDKLLGYMANDKKRDGDKIRLVLPQPKLGQVDYESTYALSDLNKLV